MLYLLPTAPECCQRGLEQSSPIAVARRRIRPDIACEYQAVGPLLRISSDVQLMTNMSASTVVVRSPRELHDGDAAAARLA